VLRSAATFAEAIVWRALRDRRLNGLKFVRQGPVGPYFFDFIIRERMVVFEIDGATDGDGEHHELAHDAVRADHLTAEGYRIYRISNADAYDNLDGVLDGLVAFIGDEDQRGGAASAKTSEGRQRPVRGAAGHRTRRRWPRERRRAGGCSHVG